MVQEAAGHFNTVWGLKNSGATSSIELYFYDYERTFTTTSPNIILNSVSQLLSVDLHVPTTTPFFMWSIEIDPTEDKIINDIDLYFSGAGGTISSGECYTLGVNNYEFKNIYYFFESERDKELIYEALTSGPRAKIITDFPSFLHPRMASEQVYVVARKRFSDGIYLSRVPLSKSIEILEYTKFDQTVRNFLAKNYSSLEHHLYDIGIDYKIDCQNHFSIEKSAIYGIF
ncbi:MAG: hypothetical protein DCO81_07155 [Candidatus Aquiluna sp. XM-24bin5]|nr:MAG: hypothetical protein DCO81_07155 [Candidatus Aquiluna sp. XM-24bin5]